MVDKSVGKNWENYFQEQANSIEKNKSPFETPPVPPKEFFEIWLRQPLFPEQLKAVETIFTPDFQDINTMINELLLFWGESAGKDFTVVRLLIYCCYWILSLKCPQTYFGMTPSDPLAVVNTSFSASHSSDIFFKQFCNVLHAVRNPATGNNWFEEQGMDLREGKDILSNVVRFPKNLTAYAMSSAYYSGEGKNILIGILDEIAEFRFDKAKKIYGNITNTALSRFPKHYKVILISYLRDDADFMNTHYKEAEALPEDQKSKVYFSKKKVWEVRLDRQQEDYIVAYKTDPEDAARRYENIVSKNASKRFIREFDKVLKCVRYDRNPLAREESYWSDSLLDETFQSWFKPYMSYELYLLEKQYREEPSDLLKKRIEIERESHANSSYYLHLDLSRGICDYAGLCLIHPYNVLEDQIGYYVDLMLQIRPTNSAEINFEEIRKFIFKLIEMGFPITKISMDQFQAADFVQILENRGMDTAIISMDRTFQPYETLKNLFYQQLINMYFHPYCIRELKELLRLDTKIDHPKDSPERLRDEGIKAGSKDIADSVAGSVFSAVTAEGVSDPYISTTSSTEGKIDDFINKLH